MARPKVLLVGWDAADWKVIQPLIAAGKMPNVERLVRSGAAGQIATLHPPLSPMLWTSIATGKRPFKHGIHGFTEPTPDGLGVRPVTNLSRKSKAIWNILSQNDLRSVVIGWWPSHPAEPIHGVMVSDRYHRASGPLDQGWPMPANTVHPTELSEILAGLRTHPDFIQPEMAERFVSLAKEIDQDDDKRLAMLLRTLAECMSIHAAAVWLLDNQPWDLFAVYFEAIDHFCHSFMRYHPPRQPWISGRDFELYRNVVSMAYQLHDEMLGELMKKAGGEATVILMSDHGFHPDHLRPASIPDIPAGPAVEHREQGIFAMTGPGIKQQETLYGVSILDVTPTILSLFDLPVGEDMDGKVLTQAFLQPAKLTTIPSWEEIRGADGRHPAHTRLDPAAAQEALERLIELGYIERPDENRELAVKAAIRDLQYNLGEAYQDGGRHAEAYEIFTRLHEADPGEQRFAVRLFVSCQALGLHDEMQRIVDMLDCRQCGPVVDYLSAQVSIAEERYEEALRILERLRKLHLTHPRLSSQTAELYLRLGRTVEAQQAFENVLRLDPDDARAYIGLCKIALRRRKYKVAAQSALDALQRAYHEPLAHFLLGRALSGMKEYERAAEAFRAAISFNPHFPEAHLRLASVLERLGDIESAREHRRLARTMEGSGRVQEVRCADAHPNSTAAVPGPPDARTESPAEGPPPLSESVIVVTGLPRSGTSLLMQMLAAGGLNIASDDLRPADEDNPRGYFEYAPVKSLLRESNWLFEARGKAIKIVAPLLAALPQDLPCRVVFCERNLDEVLDSQDRMLLRHNSLPAATPNSRQTLKAEYARTVDRMKAMLAARPVTQVLFIEHSAAISDPILTAELLNRFLSGTLNTAEMAAAVDPSLYRTRRR